jgi:uncharacterized membrane protein
MSENNDISNSPEPVQPKRSSWLARSFRPFRTATLRGLAIILPPLLTSIFFFWAWNVIESYLITPVESALTRSIAYSIQRIEENPAVQAKLVARNYTLQGRQVVTDDGEILGQLESGQWIPTYVIEIAQANSGKSPLVGAGDHYEQYVKSRHLQRHLFIPAFLALFLAILYLLGKLLAAGIGRIFLAYLETLITQLPIIRNVYSSVKQVTDFALNENEMSFSRIVAVEYPRKGIWSMGFVTGDGMRDIRDAAGEPILTVLMPTSPMPATGFTISIPKSETIDLNITIDQAVQFCVSCGVVIPDHQQTKNTIEGEVRNRFRQITQQSTPGNGATEEAAKKPTSSTDN